MIKEELKSENWFFRWWEQNTGQQSKFAKRRMEGEKRHLWILFTREINMLLMTQQWSFKLKNIYCNVTKGKRGILIFSSKGYNESGGL